MVSTPYQLPFCNLLEAFCHFSLSFPSQPPLNMRPSPPSPPSSSLLYIKFEPHVTVGYDCSGLRGTCARELFATGSRSSHKSPQQREGLSVTMALYYAAKMRRISVGVSTNAPQ